MKLGAVYILLAFVFLIKFTISIKVDANPNIFDYEDVDNKVKCSVTQDEVSCKNNFMNKLQFMDTLLKRKPNLNAASPLASFQNIEQKEARIIPYYHSTQPMSCSCGVKFGLFDLGVSYYPRFVHTGDCQSNGCGGLYRCIPKHYKVRVLKRRSTSDSISGEMDTIDNLPDSLRDNWKSDVVTVTVACECAL